MQTLVDSLRQAKDITERGFTFLSADLSPDFWSFPKLIEEADRRARYFRSLGLRKGDRLGMVVPDSRSFVLSFYGAMLAGIIPVPMYPPLALGSLDGYLQKTGRILKVAGARTLLASKQVASLLWSLTSRVDSLENLVTCETMDENRENRFEAYAEITAINPDDTCFLQFTSGSTADPKGVVVTHGNLMSNIGALANQGLGVDPTRDHGVSWLPLYHDMGLIGFVLAPMLVRAQMTFIPTLTFLKRPSIWMKTIADCKGTITFAPNFAFGLAAKRQGRAEQLDLRCLRVLGCGAEPINADTMRRFLEKFEPSGLNPNALMPCYGMAEATLAVSFAGLDQPFQTTVIDREQYEEHRRAVPFTGTESANGIELVSCGRTFAEHEVAIVDRKNRMLPEGMVGEIVFRGPSVTPGYFGDPKTTSQVLRGNWLHTGDHGFTFRGELYVSGREKDMIIIHGRNYYPQAFEWEVERVEGVRAGNSVAFSVPGADTERLVIVAEARAKNDLALLAERIERAVGDAFGVRVHEVRIVKPGSLPKTSSGKLQRRNTRELYLKGTLETHADRRSDGGRIGKLKLFRHLAVSAISFTLHSVKNLLPRRNRD